MEPTKPAGLLKRFALPLAACVAVALVAACGGGGGGSQDDACASRSFLVTTSWTVSGGTYFPSAASQIVGRVGVPLRARPVHTGIPAACADQATYALWDPGFPLPPGLTLDTGTGEIRGTPTAATTASAGGNGVIWAGFPGFSSVRVLHTLRIEP